MDMTVSRVELAQLAETSANRAYRRADYVEARWHKRFAEIQRWISAREQRCPVEDRYFFDDEDGCQI
jgi:hypothetical protein